VISEEETPLPDEAVKTSELVLEASVDESATEEDVSTDEDCTEASVEVRASVVA
jgi:hypothetical protein